MKKNLFERIKKASINKLSKIINNTAKEKGFWMNPNIGEKLMLMVSELGEALEADRKNKFTNKDTLKDLYHEFFSNSLNSDELDLIKFKQNFENNIKDTFEDELADAIIRILDLCAFYNIDIKKHISLKMLYNNERPFLHNKKY